MNVLLQLALLFGGLSLIAFGGGSGILPAVQHEAVDVQHWLTGREFIDFFAIARAAPGPGSTVVMLVGLKAAGALGAVVAAVTLFGPSSLLMFAAAKGWRTLEGAAWRRTAEAALAPIAVGLTFATGLSLLQGTEHGWVLYGITAVSMVVLTVTDWHPGIVLAAGGVVSLLL